jgi:hypothetical protein
LGPAQWETLTERKVGAKVVMGQPAPRASGPVATLVDMPAVPDRPVAPKSAARPVTYADTSEQAASQSGTFSSPSISVMHPLQIRRWKGLLSTAALVAGVVVLGYTLKDVGGKGTGRAGGGAIPAAHPPPPGTSPDIPFVPALPGVAAPTGAPGPGKPLAAYKPSQLPEYDPNAPGRPKPPPKPEHVAPHFGHGAWLSVEANRVARVFVDGHDTELLTPVKRLSIAPGTHRIRLVAAMGADGSSEFELVAKRGKTAYRYGKLDE